MKSKKKKKNNNMNKNKFENSKIEKPQVQKFQS